MPWRQSKNKLCTQCQDCRESTTIWCTEWDDQTAAGQPEALCVEKQPEKHLQKKKPRRKTPAEQGGVKQPQTTEATMRSSEGHLKGKQRKGDNKELRLVARKMLRKPCKPS